MNYSREIGNAILERSTKHQDYNHASDETYKKLRAQAEKEQNQQHQLAEKASQAYNSGQKSEAHEFSEQAKAHGAKAQDLNNQAAAWVFRENNADSQADEIDLHGLFVKEAISALDARIHAGASRGEKSIQVIVGKGIHSQNHIAKLKPAVEEYCQANHIAYEVKHGNTGVLVLNIAGQSGQNYSGSQSFPVSGQQGSAQNYYNQGNNQNGQGYQQQGYQQQGYQQQGYQQQGYQQQQQSGGGWQSQINQQNINTFLRVARQLMRVFKSC